MIVIESRKHQVALKKKEKNEEQGENVPSRRPALGAQRKVLFDLGSNVKSSDIAC